MRFPARLAAVCLLIAPGMNAGQVLAAPPPPARPPVPLAAHRALYELTLELVAGQRPPDRLGAWHHGI